MPAAGGCSDRKARLSNRNHLKKAAGRSVIPEKNFLALASWCVITAM